MDAATNESSSDSSCTVVGSGSSADNVNSALVWLGTAMVIAASFVSCFGLNLQKLSHNQNEEKDQADRKPMYKSWTWVLGLGCMVLGSILDVLALPFVPMSRVSALGASGMIANIMITPLFLKETVTNHDLLGGTVTIVGTTIACYFGAQSEPVISSDCLLENFTQDMFIFFAIVVAVMIAVLVYLMIGFKKTQEAAVEAGLTVQYLECVSAWQKLEDLQSLPQDKTFRFFTQFGPQFYPVVFAVFAGTVGAFSVMFVKVCPLPPKLLLFTFLFFPSVFYIVPDSRFHFLLYFSNKPPQLYELRQPFSTLQELVVWGMQAPFREVPPFFFCFQFIECATILPYFAGSADLLGKRDSW